MPCTTKSFLLRSAGYLFFSLHHIISVYFGEVTEYKEEWGIYSVKSAIICYTKSSYHLEIRKYSFIYTKNP